MDDEFWIKVYREWTKEDLENEIGTCHRYQQDLLARTYQRQIDMGQGIRLMITSQSREYIIQQVIREKITNGIT